jgi:hypothetical protein
MERSELRRQRRQRRKPEQIVFNQQIKDGVVVPIIGNAIRNEQVFNLIYARAGLGAQPAPANAERESFITLDERLAQEWADAIGYPLPDRNRLARVARYNRINNRNDPSLANTEYLSFLKTHLLDIADEYDEDVSKDLIEELYAQYDRFTFSHIAHELGYPKFNGVTRDSLRLLASLPFRTYVTTSYYDFLERALQAEGKKPLTQVCFWSGEPSNMLEEHRPQPEFQPTQRSPLVYHLHGLERYPETLILSEDDFLDYLVRIARDTNQEKPLIPLYLREILAESALLLLGYRLQEWDFRVLFRGIINDAPISLRPLSLAIQLDPEEQDAIDDEQQAKEYLKQYFGEFTFRVEWGKADEYVSRLKGDYTAWEKGAR